MLFVVLGLAALGAVLFVVLGLAALGALRTIMAFLRHLAFAFHVLDFAATLALHRLFQDVGIAAGVNVGLATTRALLVLQSAHNEILISDPDPWARSGDFTRPRSGYQVNLMAMPEVVATGTLPVP